MNFLCFAYAALTEMTKAKREGERGQRNRINEGEKKT